MVINVSVFGCDFKSSWSFSNGDLELVSDSVNMGQAIVNRLNTDLDFYNWCYTRYGGDLFRVLGMKNNNKSLEYLQIEIKYILQQDPRIRDLTVTCTKTNSKTIKAELDILPIGSDEIVTLNLVITDNLIVMLDDKYMDVRI